jgi:hypothetical protein
VKSAAVVALALAGWWATIWIRPPHPLPTDAPAERFSAERAAAHLEWIAAEPHPVGTPAHRAVRQRLANELRALGLEVEIQRVNWPVGDEKGMKLVNVLARRPGTAGADEREVVLVVSHYDSVPEARGAGDDGSGVAAMLETARATAQDAAGRRELVLLFTDGEEVGLRGARALMQIGHPWVSDLRAVLNFEARGVAGPSILFQVGPTSGDLVALYAQHAPSPFGSSLAPAVYARLPNDTDFTVFLERELPGLNFAFLGGGAAYHHAGDQPASLSLASLQHHGEAMTALVRALVPGNEPRVGAPAEREFFSVPGALVTYPRALTLPAGIGLVLFALALIAVHVARFGLGTLARGTAAALLLFAAAGTAVVLGSRGALALGDLVVSTGLFGAPTPSSNAFAGELLSVGAWLVALAVGVFGAALLAPRGLAAGAVLLQVPGALLLPLLVPGAGHIGVLALLGSGAAWSATSPRAEDAEAPPDLSLARTVAGLALWFAAAIVMLPLIALLVQVGSVTRAGETFLAGVAAAAALVTAMPLLAATRVRGKWLAPALLAMGLTALAAYAILDALTR